MAKKTKKSSVGSKLGWARKIYEAQKKDYQRIFKKEVSNSDDPKKAAKRAGEIYRSRYGRTATQRWHNALEKAK